MMEIRFEPVILNKIILYAIAIGLLYNTVEIACLELKNSPLSQTNNSIAAQSCQVNDCEMICSDVSWSWPSFVIVYSQV